MVFLPKYGHGHLDGTMRSSCCLHLAADSRAGGSLYSIASWLILTMLDCCAFFECVPMRGIRKHPVKQDMPTSHTSFSGHGIPIRMRNMLASSYAHTAALLMLYTSKWHDYSEHAIMANSQNKYRYLRHTNTHTQNDILLISKKEVENHKTLEMLH